MTAAADQRRRLRGNRCLCSGCGHLFGSVSAFDRHQREPDGQAQCLPADVFAASGPDGKPPRLFWSPSRQLWVTQLREAKR